MEKQDPQNQFGSPLLHEQLRFGWLFTVLLILLPVSSICSRLHKWVSPRKRPTEIWNQWARIWVKSTLSAASIHIRYEKKSEIPNTSGACILVYNQQNTFTNLMQCAYDLPPRVMVTDHKFRNHPGVKYTAIKDGLLMLDHRKNNQADVLIREGTRAINNGEGVMISPEGTRSYSIRMNSFHRGAFALAVESNTPVIPVITLNGCKLVSEKEKACRPGTLRVVVEEPIFPPRTEKPGKAVKLLKNQTEQVMESWIQTYSSNTP